MNFCISVLLSEETCLSCVSLRRVFIVIQIHTFALTSKEGCAAQNLYENGADIPADFIQLLVDMIHCHCIINKLT